MEPVHGIELMKCNRTCKKLFDLTNGPSKLCISFNISKSLFDQVDLTSSQEIWIQETLSPLLDITNFEIVEAKRIGISNSGEEAANKPYRFYIKHNKYVSLIAKEEETH